MILLKCPHCGSTDKYPELCAQECTDCERLVHGKEWIKEETTPSTAEEIKAIIYDYVNFRYNTSDNRQHMDTRSCEIDYEAGLKKGMALATTTPTSGQEGETWEQRHKQAVGEYLAEVSKNLALERHIKELEGEMNNEHHRYESTIMRLEDELRRKELEGGQEVSREVTPEDISEWLNKRGFKNSNSLDFDLLVAILKDFAASTPTNKGQEREPLYTELTLGQKPNTITINCFDEDSEMSIVVRDNGRKAIYSMDMDEVGEVVKYMTAHLNNEREAVEGQEKEREPHQFEVITKESYKCKLCGEINYTDEPFHNCKNKNNETTT